MNGISPKKKTKSPHAAESLPFLFAILTAQTVKKIEIKSETQESIEIKERKLISEVEFPLRFIFCKKNLTEWNLEVILWQTLNVMPWQANIVTHLPYAATELNQMMPKRAKTTNY